MRPSRCYLEDYYEAEDSEQRQQHKSWREAPGRLPDRAENKRWKESAKSARRADQTRYRADRLREVFRHEFEYRPIAQPDRSGHSQRADGERDHHRASQKNGHRRRHRKNPKQNLPPADTVGEHSADRTHRSRQRDKPGGPEPRVTRRQLEYLC